MLFEAGECVAIVDDVGGGWYVGERHKVRGLVSKNMVSMEPPGSVCRGPGAGPADAKTQRAIKMQLALAVDKEDEAGVLEALREAFAAGIPSDHLVVAQATYVTAGRRAPAVRREELVGVRFGEGGGGVVLERERDEGRVRLERVADAPHALAAHCIEAK